MEGQSRVGGFIKVDPVPVRALSGSDAISQAQQAPLATSAFGELAELGRMRPSCDAVTCGE